MARARFITSGLRNSGTNGPDTSALRAPRNSSIAFFCASVIFSTGIGGMRFCALTLVADPIVSRSAESAIDILDISNSLPTQTKGDGSNRRLDVAAPWGRRLFQVLAHQLRHREHVHRSLAPEHRLELVVGVDHPLVL